MRYQAPKSSREICAGRNPSTDIERYNRSMSIERSTQAPAPVARSGAAPAPAHAAPGYEADHRDYERRWWTLGVLCISLVMIVVANASLNVALPTLVSDLHASSSSLQWIVDAYGLVFAGLLLTAGSLGDRFGRRLALNGGLVIFGAASAAAALSGSASALIAARAVMGVGAAFIMPATLSILAHVFPPNERPRAIAIWAAFAGIGERRPDGDCARLRGEHVGEDRQRRRHDAAPTPITTAAMSALAEPDERRPQMRPRRSPVRRSRKPGVRTGQPSEPAVSRSPAKTSP